MEKTKKLLEKLSQNSALYSVIQKDAEKVKQTIAFQNEVEECLEEIKTHEANFISLNNCVSGNEATPKNKDSGEVAVCDCYGTTKVEERKDGKKYCGQCGGLFE